MSVNVPTNQKIKEKDVNAKLQLYGIYAAFAKGKVPSNKQIDVAMNTALEWNGLRQPNKKLSAEGQLLIADLRDVIEKAKILLLSKNEGNLLQDFIYRTQDIGTGGATVPGAPVDKETAKQHGNDALEGLRTLGNLIVTNGQFRKLLSDATILLRDIAGDAAQKAAGKVNPSDDQLNQIDHPAEDNTWHDTPDYTGIRDNIRSKTQFAKKDAKDVGSQAVGDATEAGHGSRDPADAAAAAQDQGSQAVDAKQGGKAGISTLRQNASDRMSEDQKQKMREYRERTNNYFKEKVPKDRRDQTVYRLKKMIVEIQTHQDYQQAIETLLRLAEDYAGHGKNYASQGKESAKGIIDKSRPMLTDLKELLERFANGTSFDDFFDSLDQIRKDAQKDEELKQWFKDMDKFIRRALQEQGYIIEEQSNQDWNKLYDKGHFLLRERYRSHTDRVFDEVKFIGGQFDEDPENKAFAKSMDKMFNDLGNDQEGKPTFKPHLVKDLTEVLIPAFFENVRYVPIPRIEYSDKMIDAVVENLVIEGDNLAPNQFDFGSDNFWSWGRKGIASKNKNKVLLSASGIQMDLRDVAYYVKKKEGFPGITDKGVMDIFLGGTGLSFKVAMETADKSDRNHFFKINTVTVDIKNMNIKLKQSNHKLLFGLFKPILFKVMRPVIQKVVEKQVRDNVTKLDAFLYRVKQDVDRSTEEAKSSLQQGEAPENVYKRYSSAFQRELQKTKDRKEAAKAKVENAGQVNVAMTQHDSIFKNIQLPGGISTKATEFKTLAEKGDKWESPVFSIGSAKESSNIPHKPKPTRKPHNATPAVVKDHPDTSLHGSQIDSGNIGGPTGTTGGSSQYNTQFGQNNFATQAGSQGLSINPAEAKGINLTNGGSAGGASGGLSSGNPTL